MGMSIVWIVLFHSGITPPSNSLILRALWYIFISFGGGFGVDIFFMLSGFGLMYSVLKNQENYSWKSYFRKRFSRILPTYLLVASCYYLITCDNVWNFFYNLLFLNFISEGIRDFWYIFAILVFYLIFPLIAKFALRTTPAFAVGIFIILAQIVCVITYKYSPVDYSHLEIMLQRFPCFCIGIYMGAMMFSSPKSFLPFALLCTIAGGVLIFTNITFTGDSRWIFTLMSLPVLCLMVGVLSIPLSKIFSTPLKWLGKRSLELYLVHVSFGVMLMNIISNRPLALIVYFVSSILLTALVHNLINSKLNLTKSRI